MNRRHLELAKKTGSRLLELQAVGNLGTLLELESSSPEAFHLLEKAVHLAGKYGGPEALSISHANLGRTLQRSGRMKEALKHMETAFNICLDEGILIHQIDYAYELSHIFMDMGRLDRAATLIKQIKEWPDRNDDGCSLALCRGRLLRLQNRKQEAVKALTEGLKKFSDSADRISLLEQLYLATGDRNTLNECIKCGEDTLRETTDWHMQKVLDDLKDRTYCPGEPYKR
jgi:tetratricopeptide (TPR) repeat protein